MQRFPEIDMTDSDLRYRKRGPARSSARWTRGDVLGDESVVMDLAAICKLLLALENDIVSSRYKNQIHDRRFNSDLYVLS